MSVPRFQIIPTRQGGYAWRFLSGNNRTIASSTETFTERGACEKAIEEARALAPVIRRLSPGAYTWQLPGVTTTAHPTRENAEKTADTFRDNAPHAPVRCMMNLKCPR